MKIMFLSTGMGLGGAEQQIIYISSQLHQRGHEVFIISLSPLGPMGREAREMGLLIDSLKIPRGMPDPRALVRMIQQIRKWRPDILCCFMFHANVLGRVAGRLAGVPVLISSIRNENFGGKRRDLAMRITDRMGDVTTTNSSLAAESLIRRRVVPIERFRVIPNGIITNHFQLPGALRTISRNKLGIGNDSFLWLAVGRLKEQKDYFTLLRAIGRIAESNIHLIVAGPGPLEGQLKLLARELSVEKKIHFLGFRQDIPWLLAASDGFVLSSSWEGMPNVVMEALAAGKPVVATNVGGVPELVIDGKSGYLISPGSPEALAGAMLRVMELSEAHRHSMGEYGRKYIQENYSLDQVVNMWEGLFLEYLSKKGNGPNAYGKRKRS